MATSIKSPVSPSKSDHHWTERTIEVDLAEKASIGILLSQDSPPRVIKLLPSSSFLGKIFVGDKILSVNGEAVANFTELHKRCRGHVIIKISRDEYCTVTITKLPNPKPGYEAVDVEMQWRAGGMPLGILVYHDSENRVIVSIVESGTLASSSLKPGDFVAAVNDQPCLDKHNAKKAILDAMNTKNKVKLTIHRPEDKSLMQAPTDKSTAATLVAPPTDEKSKNKSEMKSVQENIKTAKITPKSVCSPPPVAPAPKPPAPKLPNFDLTLPADVLAIMAENKDFYKKPNTNEPILKKEANPNAARLSYEGNPAEDQIEFDAGPKALKATPKRFGS